ncbi:MULTISPECIES: hypothetical protein [Acinetobacter]|uniref:hypothetical protein n=1 Tax=Acinetobacter TaxID=469 RepID=UPI00124BE2B3|nr:MULTISPECIES: hypothetical protein [Acinetobacter]MBJ9370544.1 hypothetical protein [Acinetobacter sp. TGL-Y2]MDA3440001.1 hypothetical protein [Acinetobacter bereziniae]
MIPLLKQGNVPKNTEDLLENVTDSIEKLGLHISAMTRMDYDDGIPSDEFNAIMCGLHLQIYEIYQQIENFKA